MPLHHRLVVLLFGLELACSSPKKGGERSCESVCDEAAEPFEVGRQTRGRIEELTGDQQMVYGPQGGQHFYVDARLNSPVEGRVRLRFEFIDDSGRVMGVGRAQADSTGCGTLLEEIPIVMEEDARRSGDLRVTAELLECSWLVDVPGVNVVPPLDELRDGGAVFDASSP